MLCASFAYVNQSPRRATRPAPLFSPSRSHPGNFWTKPFAVCYVYSYSQGRVQPSGGIEPATIISGGAAWRLDWMDRRFFRTTRFVFFFRKSRLANL